MSNIKIGSGEHGGLPSEGHLDEGGGGTADDWDDSKPILQPTGLTITAATDGMDILLIVVVHGRRAKHGSAEPSTSRPPNLGLAIPNLMHAGQGPFKIDAVHTDSPCAGSLQVGDVVMAVDRQTPASNTHLVQLFSKANNQQCCTVTVRRVGLMKGQSEHRRRLVQEAGRTMTPDYTIFIAYMEHRKDGPSLGLLIKHREYKVLVSRVEQNTLTSMTLQRGDRIMDVNGQPMTDKEVAKGAILDSMKRKVPFTLLIARPSSDKAKREVDDLLMQATVQKANANDKFVDLLPVDVQAIAKCEQMRRRQAIKEGQPLAPRTKPLLVVRPAAPSTSNSMYGVEAPSIYSTSPSLRLTPPSEGDPLSEPYQTPPPGGKHTPVTLLTARLRRPRFDTARRTVSFTKKPTEHKIAVITDPTARLKHLGKRYT